jgi:uncharacterized membrane protein
MLETIRLALHPQFHLLWNVFLALVPLMLALWLFRHTRPKSWLWWPGLLVFVAFLPNAAYTVTDIIHFIDEVRDDTTLPELAIVYVVIPKYVAFMFVGFQAHVISLIRVGSYLRWIGRQRWVVPTEIFLNLLCSIGVFWGRYLRLNSWEIVTRPQKLAHQVIATLSNEIEIGVIVRYFLVITTLYYVVKLIDLAVWEYWQERRLRWTTLEMSAIHESKLPDNAQETIQA